MSDTQIQLDAISDLMLHIQQQSLDRMHLQAGQCVLDVGCGAGADTLAMARAVGTSGVVHGVDYDVAMIAQAWQQSQTEDVAWVTYHHANATALPWQNNYFNASRSDRIFQHMLDPEHAFDELLRVTQPGGRVVVISGDWATLSVDSDEPDIESRQAHFIATLATDNPISGCCLRGLFVQRGMLDIQIDIHPAFRETTESSGRWQQSIQPSAASSGLFASANVVVISACKPRASQ